ncbi:hypothetical protein CBS101457_000860 [Exobasidium rhododendri]|nr:hypothetical protein CBS101457_000860 [Exobasidium rhododendri]
MGLFSLIAALIVLVISVAISVLISQPFTGALVRLRANYLPKAVSLDNVLEDGLQGGSSGGVRGVTPRAISGYFLRERQSTAKIGPIVSGILAMMARTKKLEGWSGIYKGSAPVVSQLFVLGFFTFMFYSGAGARGAGGGQYRSAPSGPGQFGFWSNLFFMIITSLVALPLNVITNRAIVHPRILTFRNPRKSLGELLSFSEFSQPWRLYLTPGLLATELIHITWIGMLTRIVRHLAIPALGGLPPSTPASPNDDTYTGPSSGNLEFSTFGLAVFLAWCVLSVVVLSPLECVIVRLSVQRSERQQPLHLAYARAPSSAATPSGPASYNNQAQVPTVIGRDTAQNDAPFRDSTLSPSGLAAGQAQDAQSRPSFAITDEDEEEGEGDVKQGEVDQAPKKELIAGLEDDSKEFASTPTSATPTTPPSTSSHLPPRVLGRAEAPQGSSLPQNMYSGMEQQPSEPVIALRPCDEPQSIEEAAQAEQEGFGAPTVERYTGMIDCLNKLVDEEGIEALYRGAWVTLMGVLVGNFSSL